MKVCKLGRSTEKEGASLEKLGRKMGPLAGNQGRRKKQQSSPRDSLRRQQAIPVCKRCVKICMHFEAPLNLLFGLSVTNYGVIIVDGC